MTQQVPFPQSLRNRDAARLKAYADHLKFYKADGNAQWLDTRTGRQRKLTLNYTKTLIDKVSSYVMSGLNFAVDPADGYAQAAAQATENAIYRVYQDNDLELLDLETEIDTAILGDGCYKITWDPTLQRIRVTAPDIQGVFAWWAPDDTGQIVQVATRYSLPQDDAANIYPMATLPTAAGTSASTTIVERWTAAEFDIWAGDQLLRQADNPYGFIPFVIFPNLREPKSFWGASDVPPLQQAARELNREMSAISNILELSGNPIAVLENVDKAEDIAVQPGAVWTLPADTRAYLIDLLAGGGVKLHIDYLDALRRTLHDLGETPRAAFGDTPVQLSGVALELDMHPLLQKVKRKRLIRTVAYKRRNEMILRLLERFAGEHHAPYRSRVIWGPVLPQDRSRTVQDENILVGARIHSRRRAMDNLGVQDPDKEVLAIVKEASELPETTPQSQPAQ